MFGAITAAMRGGTDGVLQLRPVSAGRAHDERQAVAAVEFGIGVDGAGVGVVDAQEIAMRRPEFPHGGLARLGPDEADRRAFDRVLAFLDLRAGEASRGSAGNAGRPGCGGPRCKRRCRGCR